MIHPRLSVNALSSFNWSFEQDLALWKKLGVHHAGLLISKIGDDVNGKLQRLADEKIQPTTIVCGSFALRNPETWNAHRDFLCQLVDSVAANTQNCSIYFTPGRTTGAPWDELVDLLTDAVKPCVEHASKNNIRMAFEPSLRTDASFVHSIRDSIDVAQKTGLGMIVDFANCWMERDLDKTLLVAAPHIALVQIDDVIIGDSSNPSPGGRVNIGEGELPLSRLIQAVVATGYAGAYDLEVLGPVVEKEGYEKSLQRGVKTASDWLYQEIASAT